MMKINLQQIINSTKIFDYSIKEIISNFWIGLIVILIVGIIIGKLIIKPLLKKKEKKARAKKRWYSAHLFFTLSRVSYILGIIVLINIIYFLPFKSEIAQKYTIILRLLNTIVLTFIFGEIFVFIYEKKSNKKIDTKVSSLFHILIRLFVYSAGVFVISSILKYDIKAMLTALGVGGLAIALALQDTLSNLFAGMQILASKQLRPGDYIQLENSVEGYVVDINWRNTSLKTLLGNIIIVPNSKISQAITINYSALQKYLYFQISVGVHYNSDLDFVEKITLEVADEILKQYSNVPNDFKPRVRFYEFADSSVNFKVWLATDLYEKKALICHEFVKALHIRYKEENIEIPFPIRTVHIK